jgi:hypothetical protein
VTLQEIAELIHKNLGYIIIALMSVVEISKIKINPWTALFEWVGNLLMSGVKNDIKRINAELKSVKQELGAMKYSSEQNEAKAARTKILRCSDEVYRGDRHSKEYFDNILEDIKTYTDYCRDHQEFKNEKAVIAIRRIEEVYERCLRDHSFL